MNLFPKGLFKPGKTTGVRPEHIVVLSPASSPAPDGMAAMAGVVDFTECLGSETLVHLRVAGVDKDVISRANGFFPLRAGDEVSVCFDPSKTVEF